MMEIVSEYEKYLETNLSLLTCIAAIICLISSYLNKKNSIRLLVMYMIVVFYLTFLNRNYGIRLARFTPFWSYRLFFSDRYLRNEILCNIIFFIPLGALLYRIHPKKSAVLAIIFISYSIELLQYITARGLLEIDDIISNTIGGLLGIMAVKLCIRLRIIIHGLR